MQILHNLFFYLKIKYFGKGSKVFKRIVLILQNYTNWFESIWIHILKDMIYFRKKEKEKKK